MLHSCGGGLSMLLAVCQVFLGLALSHAASWTWALWGSWLAFLLAATLLLSLDNLPLASPSSAGESPGSFCWGWLGAKDAHGRQPPEAPAQSGLHNEGCPSTDGQAHGLPTKGKGRLVFWPRPKASIQGHGVRHDRGLSRDSSAFSAAEELPSNRAAGTSWGAWSFFRSHSSHKGMRAKEALAAQVESPPSSEPEAGGALRSSGTGVAEEAAFHEAVQVQVADCRVQVGQPCEAGGALTLHEPSVEKLNRCPQASTQGGTSIGAAHATDPIFPTNPFIQPLEQMAGSSTDSSGWQPNVGDPTKVLAPLTEGKAVALPLLHPESKPGDQAEDARGRPPAGCATAGEDKAARNSTSGAGVAAGVEGRVVVESREEANRRKFALISSQLRQQSSTIQVDKYNVKATIVVPPDLAAFKESLLKQ